VEGDATIEGAGVWSTGSSPSPHATPKVRAAAVKKGVRVADQQK
jgi:hypothetical protein